MSAPGVRRPLLVTAGFEVLAGLPMLVAPALAITLLQAQNGPTVRVLVMIFGAAIISLGVLAWAVADAEDPARRRASWAFVGYHIAAALILGYGFTTHVLGGPLASGAAIAHLVLAAVLGRALTAQN